ncbi:MAG: hypothetical protein JSR71_13605 [Proteobacteria bacterium]|nr:hypothetical protein [Pseudomonadota bacterium]
MAYSYGTRQGSVQPGQQQIAAYVRRVFAGGSRERIGLQLYYHYGPLAVLGEYTLAQQNV